MANKGIHHLVMTGEMIDANAITSTPVVGRFGCDLNSMSAEWPKHTGLKDLRVVGGQVQNNRRKCLIEKQVKQPPNHCHV